MRFKQETLHQAAAILARTALSGALWISCIGLTTLWPTMSSHAEGTLDPTLGDQVASMRLIAAPGLTNGRYSAAIDIAMEAGAHTYWKQPGDAGVPPVFSFNGSENVAEARVVFPTPSRISEEGIEAFGYTDEATFPVLVTPRDASKPVVLKADVTYAVCRKICVPGHGMATLNLPPKAESADTAKVETALTNVPIPISAALRQDLTIEPVKGTDKPTWTLTWSGKTPVADIFAEAPEGFYFETKKTGPGRFKLTAAQVVAATKTTSVPVSLVLALAPHGVVANETLDVAASTN